MPFDIQKISDLPPSLQDRFKEEAGVVENAIRNALESQEVKDAVQGFVDFNLKEVKPALVELDKEGEDWRDMDADELETFRLAVFTQTLGTVADEYFSKVKARLLHDLIDNLFGGSEIKKESPNVG